MGNVRDIADLAEVKDAVIIKQADNNLLLANKEIPEYPGIELEESEVSELGVNYQEGQIYYLLQEKGDSGVFQKLGLNTKNNSYVVCYEMGEAYQVDSGIAKQIIKLNLKNKQIYIMSLTQLEQPIGDGINIDLTLPDGSVIKTADGTLNLPYAFEGKQQGEYTIQAYGDNYITKTITVIIVDKIENADSSELLIYTKEQLANIGKGLVVYNSDIVYEGQTVANKGKWNYADNYTYKIMADIDLSSIANWEPLANFKGVLEGNNHSINNLKIDRPTLDSSGVFREITNATIKNIAFNNANTNAKSDSALLVGKVNSGTISNIIATNLNCTALEYRATGLVGIIFSGTIENCNVQGSIKANAGNASGLVGNVNLNNDPIIIRNNITNVTVEGVQNVAGLCGVIDGTNMQEGSSAEILSNNVGGQIRSANGSVGGLIGVISITDLNIYNDNINVVGNISKTNVISLGSSSGGLIGYMDCGNIINNSATGVVSSEGYNAGGLVGAVRGGILKKNYSTGSVTVKNYSAGGLIGALVPNNEKNKTIIEENYATGNVTAGIGHVAGLIGLVNPESVDNNNIIQIKNNYVLGSNLKVAPTEWGIAGLIGFLGWDGSQYVIKVNMENNYVVTTFDSSNVKRGGLLGYVTLNSGKTTVTCQNNYWNTTTSGTSASSVNSNYSGITGLTTSQMQVANPFSGWSTDIWNFKAGEYPRLKWQIAE